MRYIRQIICAAALAAFTLSCHSASMQVPAGVVKQSIEVQNIRRDYYLLTPAVGKPVRGLVMLFHGHTGSAEHLLGMKRTASPYVRWLDIARSENLILLIPQGEIGGDGKRGWADCRLAASQPPTDDLAFIDAMLVAVQKKYPINPKHVFAVGTSNGGHFVLRLAHERPGFLAAAGVIVAAEAAESRCAKPSQPLPILFMEGTDDPLSKWNGGHVGKDKYMRGKTLSVMDTVKYWVDINHAESKALIKVLPDTNPDDKSRVVLHRYDASVKGAPVWLYEVQGGGHTEPSIRIQYSRILSLIVGNQNRDIEMADTVWSFFEQQR